MKKTLMIAVAMLFVLSFTGMVCAQSEDLSQAAFDQAFAKAKPMKFEGQVLSHDVKCHCVVLKTEKGNLTVQDDYAKFDEEYNRAKGLKIGAKVRGEYKTVMFINYALSFNYAK